MPLGKRYFSWRSRVRDSDLASTTKLVLHTLSTYMNDDGEGPSCWPSVATIAKGSSLSKSAVKEHLAIAEDGGWIEIEKRQSSQGDQDSNRYVLSLPETLAPPDGGVGRQAAYGGLPSGPGVGHQVAPNSVSSNSIKEEREAQPQAGAENLHLEMDVVRWMEKTWRDGQRTHKIPWIKPKRPWQIRGQEERAGKEVFRRAWLAYPDSAQEPNLFAFLRDWPYQTKERKSGNRPKPMGLEEFAATVDLEA